MGAECVLCNNNNIFSRLRDRIERVVPINNMKKSVQIATNVDNKGNNVFMHSIVVHTRIGSTTTTCGFTEISELLFEISLMDKNDINMNKSTNVWQKNHSIAC